MDYPMPYKDKEKKRESNRRYKANNPEKVNASNAAYREANKATLAEHQKQWRLDNPEAYAVIHRKWKQANKDKVNTATHRRRSNIKKCKTHHTSAQWRELKAKFGNRCLGCATPESVVKLCRDHVIPIDKGGSNGIENIQPLCKSCNSWKNTQVIDLRF